MRLTEMQYRYEMTRMENLQKAQARRGELAGMCIRLAGPMLTQAAFSPDPVLSAQSFAAWQQAIVTAGKILLGPPQPPDGGTPALGDVAH